MKDKHAVTVMVLLMFFGTQRYDREIFIGYVRGQVWPVIFGCARTVCSDIQTLSSYHAFPPLSSGPISFTNSRSLSLCLCLSQNYHHCYWTASCCLPRDSRGSFESHGSRGELQDGEQRETSVRVSRPVLHGPSECVNWLQIACMNKTHL